METLRRAQPRLHTMSNSTSSTDLTTSTPPQQEGFFARFIRTIKDQINDLSYVEVVTAAGDPKIDVNPDAEKVFLGYKAEELKILARTRIELDGDILMILPTTVNNTNDVKINNEIMAIHKENVDTAVRNWNNFMQNMLTAFNFLIEITGLPRTEVLERFRTPAPGPSAPAASTVTTTGTSS